jgi:hypothetical protein
MESCDTNFGDVVPKAESPCWQNTQLGSDFLLASLFMHMNRPSHCSTHLDEMLLRLKYLLTKTLSGPSVKQKVDPSGDDDRVSRWYPKAVMYQAVQYQQEMRDIEEGETQRARKEKIIIVIKDSGRIQREMTELVTRRILNRTRTVIRKKVKRVKVKERRKRLT